MKTTAIILAILISSCFCYAQTGTLKGKITDNETGTTVNSANVKLLKKGFLLTSVKSDANGEYVFNSVPSASYTLKVECSNYQSFTKNNVLVKTDEVTIVDVTLKPSVVLTETKEEYQMKSCDKKVSRGMVSPSCNMEMSVGAATGGNYSVYDADVYSIEHNTESYDKINENIFKEVKDNPLSTFSVDVDRAAYANVRRFLNNNQQPYKDAVRIEEMINYFDYDYPQPTNGDPFSITMEMSKCPWNDKHDLVLIGLQGENINAENIPASNLVFLIDVSGSMDSPNKLALIKQAFKILVNNLRKEDKVAIVVYAGAAGIVLESTSGDQKSKIINSLDQLQAGGSTAGGEGINLAYKIAKENYIPKGNNRVILATDGDFNVGASSDGEMERLIEEKRKDGVFLSILGFGMGNYKDSKMEKISNAGNGNYAYIDNILEAKKVFGKELWGTLYTIAKDVKIQIEFNPAKVKAYRLIGYENRILNKEDFNNDAKDAGDIGCGHTVTALYEIVSADSDENVSNVDPLEYQQNKVVSSKNLMTVKLRYKKPDEDVSKLIVQKVTENDINKITDNFRFASAVAEFGMLLRDSEHKANSSYEKVLIRAKQSKGADADGYRDEFIKLVETAELLVSK